jgi:hypothetical protein
LGSVDKPKKTQSPHHPRSQQDPSIDWREELEEQEQAEEAEQEQEELGQEEEQEEQEQEELGQEEEMRWGMDVFQTVEQSVVASISGVGVKRREAQLWNSQPSYEPEGGGAEQNQPTDRTEEKEGKWRWGGREGGREEEEEEEGRDSQNSLHIRALDER